MDASEVQSWLRDRYDRPDIIATEVGAGAWSTAYGFAVDGERLVVRIGEHVADFELDRRVSAHASEELPIPSVHDLGAIGGGLHFCISDFAPGVPLESLDADAWLTTVPSVVDALEAMRRIPAPASAMPWQDFLLGIDADHADERVADWRTKLARYDGGPGAFADGMDRLRALDLGEVPQSLIHGDLINRNVHVDDGRLTGLFDWGCQKWGDHLYDLAWFEFWEPWHPNLDLAALHTELACRWSDANLVVPHLDERRRACLIHIALEHLIYNSVIDSAKGVAEVIDRMNTLELVLPS